MNQIALKLDETPPNRRGGSDGNRALGKEVKVMTDPL